MGIRIFKLIRDARPAAATICKEWHIVSEGDTCQSVIEKYRISPDEFSSWNPGIRTDCSTLWVGYGVKLCKTTSAQNFMIDRFFLNDACRPQHVNLLYKSDKMERTSAV
ncbi:LysM domain [Trichophyton rubrum]|nr:LysM domain [Trichophyton rubrum]